MEIILVETLAYNSIAISKNDEFSIKYYNDSDDYQIISKPLNVEFDLIDKDTINKGKIAAFDRAIQKEMADSQVRLNNLEQKKAELLSIGHVEG
ncbi:MAG: hypothetical protein QM500_19315 [Methylococcales bacterium]